jgi:hypothetical protein
MKKLILALVAGFMTIAFAGAYAGEASKSDTGATNSEKGTAKKDGKSKAGDATKKDDDKKKKDDKAK